MGSSFYYDLSPDAGPLRGMNRLTTWGESASTRFSGAEDKLSLDGEVNTAIVGADGEWGRWLAGWPWPKQRSSRRLVSGPDLVRGTGLRRANRVMENVGPDAVGYWC